MEAPRPPLRPETLALMLGPFDVHPTPPSTAGWLAAFDAAGHKDELDAHAAFQRAELEDWGGDPTDRSQFDGLAAFLRSRLARRTAEEERAAQLAAEDRAAFDAADAALGRLMDEREGLGRSLGEFAQPRRFVEGEGWRRFEELGGELSAYAPNVRAHRETAEESGRRANALALARERVAAVRNLLWRVEQFGDALTARDALIQWDALTEWDAEAQVTRPASAPKIRGPAASQYAEWLRDAYQQDPRRLKHAGTFAALIRAAGVSREGLRTVHRQVGYEGNALGFDHFIRLLFAADGRGVPE